MHAARVSPPRCDDRRKVLVPFHQGLAAATTALDPEAILPSGNRRRPQLRRITNWFKAHRVLGGITGFVLTAAVVAVAAWLITSDGEGGAKAGSLSAPVVTVASPLTGDTMPSTVPTGTLQLSVQNPNTMALKLTGVRLKDGSAISTGNNPNCVGGLWSMPEKTGLAINVPASATTRIDIPNTVKLVENAPTECQGVSVTIPTTASFSTG